VTARRPAGRDQAGVTMVEMAVVVALLGLVLTMAFQGLVSYQRAAASADTRQQNLDQARIVMAVLTKDLRTATEFTAATASDVTSPACSTPPPPPRPTSCGCTPTPAGCCGRP
jgi:prepilin-type N-terminal cleavage/methylation domain-containing protein